MWIQGLCPRFIWVSHCQVLCSLTWRVWKREAKLQIWFGWPWVTWKCRLWSAVTYHLGSARNSLQQGWETCLPRAVVWVRRVERWWRSSKHLSYCNYINLVRVALTWVSVRISFPSTDLNDDNAAICCNLLFFIANPKCVNAEGSVFDLANDLQKICSVCPCTSHSSVCWKSCV